MQAVSSELTDEIGPVMAFIAEQTRREDHLRRFNEATKAFTKLLDADAGDAPLEAGYAKLKEFKEEIPEDLVRASTNKQIGAARDADRIANCAADQTRGRWLAVATVGLR